MFSQVLQGEEVTIVVDGQQRASLTSTTLTTFDPASSRRIPGIDQGHFVVSDDFDDPLLPLPPDEFKKSSDYCSSVNTWLVQVP